ncbi:MAG: D-alanine--D-alanine ligase [Chloroflexi bacterium]|nr:D-alanine--D-alanine ligase [Chloroflexota bacterium]
MKVGLAYDLKEAVALTAGQPEDALEEYDSPKTIALIAAALDLQGHSVVKLGGGREFLQNVLCAKVDIVFNIAEGRGHFRSREAQVPAVLEMLGIPYTGSDPLCLAICLDKPLSKKIVSDAGVLTPKWHVVKSKEDLRGTSLLADIAFPAIVKPAWEGSSKGVRLNSVAETPEQAAAIVTRLLDAYEQPVMAEEFIAGDEVTVGMVGNSPPSVLGMMQILPRHRQWHFVYSVEVKRDWQNLVDYECPPHLPATTLQQIEEASLKAFRALECRDFARLDFRIDAKGVPYFLEINPLPGLGDYSDLVIMALKMGWRYEGLIGAVVNAALERYPLCVRG